MKIKQYPELMKAAKEISYETIRKINKVAPTIKSEMPYKAQFILEEVIKNLEENV